LHGLLFILTLSQIDLVDNYPQLVLDTQIEFHPQEFVPSQVIDFTVSEQTVVDTHPAPVVTHPLL